MQLFNTYRFRLIAYTLALAAFLTATLVYTYFYSRDVILTEAKNNVTHTTHLLNGNIDLEESELQHYTEIVRDDIRIKEYMFMIVKVGTDSEPLQELYARHFGWLPVSRHIILSNSGQTLLGKQDTDLVQALLGHLEVSNEPIFYMLSKNGLEMVTWAPVFYQGARLGVVAQSQVLGRSWLQRHQQYSGGHIFIEQNDKVVLSSQPKAENLPLDLDEDTIFKVNDELYQMRPILLTGNLSNQSLKIWHGVSMSELLQKLEKHSRIMMLLTLVGSLAIMWVGLAIVKNFNRPLTHLINITQDVAKGHIPIISKSTQKTEIDLLTNQFAEMLNALRDKQNEIERVHKELEESAITDTLTKLYNRRYLSDIFPRLIRQAQREQFHLSGILLDVDHFKKINDRYGHLAGDQCLTHFAHVLQEISRANDYVFRMGGEEFLLISINDSIDSGRLLAEKIRSTIEQRATAYKNQSIPLTVSAGVSHADPNLSAEEALTNLLFNADKALYQAKSSGRNQVKVYTVTSQYSRTIWDKSS